MPSVSASPAHSTSTHPDGRDWPRRVSRKQQFKAILRKNFLLQTRGRKSFLGLEGWAALLFELLVPAAFFLLMCIPRHEIQPMPHPREVAAPADLDASSYGSWAQSYDGPANLKGINATILFSPNTSTVVPLIQSFAKAVACPADPGKKADFSTAFPALFRDPNPDAACNDYERCTTTPACSQHVLNDNLIGFGSPQDAENYAVQHPDAVDAIVDFATDQLRADLRMPGTNTMLLPDSMGTQSQDYAYAIRMNHTYLPSNKQVLNAFDIQPDQAYQLYWFFANLQLAIDRAILGLHLPQADQPADVRLAYKPFPWPAVTVDLAAVAAAAAFNLLLVYAFLAPTRNVVATMVREKELRLREGMRILGLQDTAYWASWAITHWSTLAASGLLCALISIYPFPHSDFSVLLALLWLIAAALVAFCYAVSTLFSSSRAAGTFATFIYAASMVPGWLTPSAQPYGGWLWMVSCLFPPSAISLFASVLLKLEAAQRGLHWGLLSLSVTQQGSFSTATVMGMLLLDVVLYGALTWYLDRVVPSKFGQNLPWYFPFQPSYWQTYSPRKPSKPASSLPDSHPLRSAASEEYTAAVSIQGLSKVYAGRGEEKRALDKLSVDMYQGQITALLGHNGAGKTTAISILTGMIPATSGDAFVGSKSIGSDMGAIRNNLGVCPQFDILWPDLTVDEHLQLYAAIKGYRDADAPGVAAEAAHDVGLEDKLSTRAGELSGGQRRKLSVAIAFLGAPAIVFLDEPTSGMDPFSRRFTWEIIKRHRENRAVVLTTHSMEEADRLADRIVIMAQGQSAAVGSSMHLKKRYGVGYTLTLALSGPEAASRQADSGSAEGPAALPASGAAQADAIFSLVRRHMETAELVSTSAREATLRLPRDDSSRISDLLQEVEQKKDELGVLSYGLSSTTLEEVFLNVSASKGADHHDAEHNPAETHVDLNSTPQAAQESHALPPRLQGVRLYVSQLWALSAKRTQTGLRDARSALFQIVVPIALVLLSLWVRKATFSAATEPDLAINRDICLRNSPTVLAASQQARANVSLLNSFVSGYDGYLVDSGADHVARGTVSGFNGSLDEHLLNAWYSGLRSYDAIDVQSFGSSSQALSEVGPFVATLMTNQTAIHALPAAINALTNALLSTLTGGEASVAVTSSPMPNLPGEQAVQLSMLAGSASA